MNWWNFQGDADNLFGTSEKANKPINPNDRTLAVNSVGLVNKWNDELENVFEFSKMYDVCKAIFNHFEKINSVVFTDLGDLAPYKCLYFTMVELIKKCKKDLDQPYGSVEHTKMLMKTFYKISFFVDEKELNDAMLNLNSIYAWYGMLSSNTKFYQDYDNHLQVKICLQNIKAVGDEYHEQNNAVNLPIALEAILMLFKIIGYGHHNKLSKRMWCMITLNLESPVPRVRELLLMIFQYVITDRPYFDKFILPQLLNEWPWTNRNKYNMLAMVFAKYKYSDLLRTSGHKNLQPEIFFRGVEMSLRYAKTMPSSQALVRVLAKENVEAVKQMVVSVLKTRPFGEEFENAIKYWLPHCEVFQLMQFNVQEMVQEIGANSEITGKPIVYRNAFAAQLNPDDSARLANAVRTHIETLPNDENVQQHVLEIFIKNVINAEMISPDDLSAIIRFLKHNTKTIAMHDLMLKQMSTLLKHLIKAIGKTTAKGEEIPNTVRAFALTIKVDLVDYEISKDLETVDLAMLEFALRMYDLIGKTFQKTTAFADLWHFDNNAIYYERLLRIQHNPSRYSNTIRETSLQLLLNTPVVPSKASKQQKTKQFFETCKLLVTGSTMRPGAFEKSFVAAPIQAKLLIQLEMTSDAEPTKKYENLHMFFGHLRSMLESNYNYDASKKDPLQTLVYDGRQLCGYVNCLSEFLLNKEVDLTKINLISKTTDLVEKVVALMLCYLNFAPGDRVCDARTDLSMDALLAKSAFKSDCDPNILKENLLTSICYTIQAVAKFFSLVGKYVITVSKKSTKSIQINKLVQVFEDIFSKCSHKPTLTVVGHYYGELFECFTQNHADMMSSSGLDNTEVVAKLISLTENSVANRAKSQHGLATFFSEMIANDCSHDKGLLSHVFKILKPKDLLYAEMLDSMDKDDEDISDLVGQLSVQPGKSDKNKKLKIPEFSDDDDDEDLDFSDEDLQSDGFSDWMSWSSAEVKDFKLSSTDEEKQKEKYKNDLKDKKYEKKRDEERVYLKQFYAKFEELQLQQLIMLLEHPKMYLRPAMVTHLRIILDLIFHKYNWGTAAEQELCLHLFEVVLPYFTQSTAPSKPDLSLDDQWQPPTISIAELIQKHDFIQYVDKFEPAPLKLFRVALKLFSQFDHRNTIARVTDQKFRFGDKWVVMPNMEALYLFGNHTALSGIYEKYNAKMEFLDDEEVRFLYAKFHSQIVLPEQLEEFIKTDLKLLIEEFFVETPNENRMIFEALHIYYMIKRAVVHCMQILLYDEEQFYKELQDLVGEVVSREGVPVARVTYNTRTYIFDLLSLIGCQPEDQAVKKLLVEPNYENYKGSDVKAE